MGKAKMAEVLLGLLTKSKIREQVKEMGLRLSKEALPALEAVIVSYLREAAERAKANGRQTIQAHDIKPAVGK